MLSRQKARIVFVCTVFAALLGGAWFRAPYVDKGLPYFYDEDEAHHFNRIVEMVQRRDYNPYYFLKPALHFYLRMPLVHAYARRAGISTHEIETRDPYGLDRYSFSASHPGAVKLLRLLSEVFSIGIIAISAVLALLLTESGAAALGAAGICALSPALIGHSGLIAVDAMMTFWCALSVYFACLSARTFTWPKFWAAAFFAGLAVSTKYSAAPIIAPLLAASCFERERRWQALAASLLVPIAVFAACNPYALTNAGLFVEHVKFEVLHYAVRGHAGHEGARGLPQAIFYFRFLAEEGLSWPAASLGALFLLGAAFNWRRIEDRALRVFVVFPSSYFLLMALQKVNFTRNMLVMIPLLSIAAAAAIQRAVPGKFLGAAAMVGLALMQIPGAAAERAAAVSVEESRLELEDWIKNSRPNGSETAVSGELQAAKRVYSARGVDRFNPALISPEELYLRGFDAAVYGPEAKELHIGAEPIAIFPGEPEPQRIVLNPEIRVFALSAFRQRAESRLAELDPEPIDFLVAADGSSRGCRGPQKSEGEDFCWLGRRISRLRIVPEAVSDKSEILISMEVMSPWPNQTLVLNSGQWLQQISLKDSEVGRWQLFTFKIPSAIVGERAVIEARLGQIHSPAREHSGSDSRRLGAAVRGVSFVGGQPIF